MIDQARDIRLSHQCGFTMMELTLAIVILAGALVVLLGLQSSVISRTVDDTNRKHAMMYARQILSAVEAREGRGWFLPEQNTTGSVDQILSELLETDTRPGGDPELRDRFQVEFRIEPWSVPGLGEQVLKRVELVIFWGMSEQERMPFYFLIPARESSDDAFIDDEIE